MRIFPLILSLFSCLPGCFFPLIPLQYSPPRRRRQRELTAEKIKMINLQEINQERESNDDDRKWEEECVRKKKIDIFRRQFTLNFILFQSLICIWSIDRSWNRVTGAWMDWGTWRHLSCTSVKFPNGNPNRNQIYDEDAAHFNHRAIQFLESTSSLKVIIMIDKFHLTAQTHNLSHIHSLHHFLVVCVTW